VSHVVILCYSSSSLIINTLACHAVCDLTLSWSKELLGENHRQALRRLTLFLNEASTECIILLYAPLYNIYFMHMIAHLRTGVGWNLVALGLLSLQRYLVYPTMV
jgi:hypothetical protein